jgi:Cu/Ag efflux protein CusF
MIPIPFTWAAAAVVIALTFGFWGGHQVTHNAWEADAAKAAEAATKIVQQQSSDSAKVETVYVDKIQRVEVPVETVRTRIVRAACSMQQPAAGGVPVPAGDSGKPADAAAPADAGSGLADDLVAAERNAIQLEQLQALIRANTSPQ